jgi:cytochrome P450
MNSLAAQAFVFFLGGFETSSSTMTFCMYELSLHQDIQNRLRGEIDDVLQKHDGKLTYEGIQEMVYLDKVVSGKPHCFDCMYKFRKHTFALHNANITKTTFTTSANFALNTG